MFNNKIIKRIKQMPKEVKASIGFFIGNVVTSGIAYLTTPIYTRLLSEEQYGAVSVYMTWMTLFGIIAMFALSYGVFNNGMIDYANDRDVYSFSMLILSNVITLLFSICIVVLYPMIEHIINMDMPLLLLMLVVFLFQPAYSFWTARQRFEYKYKKTLLFSLLIAISAPLVSIVAISTFENKLYARLFGAEIAMLIFYVGFYFYLLVRAKGKINTKYWEFALKFNLPLIPHYLSMHILSSADKIMISNIVNNTATAFYTIANSVATVVTIIWSAANSSLIPYTYEKCRVKDYKAISRVAVPLLTCFSFSCAMLIFLAPEIVWLMATNDYREAIYVIPPIVGGVFFQVQYNLYANIIYYYKKPKYVMYASVTATMANIVMNYFFIRSYGYRAAGYTTLVSYMIQALIDYWAMKKVVGCSVYNIRLILGLSIIVLCVALISPLIYDYIAIRYLLLFMIILVAFIFRRKIINLFVELKNT